MSKISWSKRKAFIEIHLGFSSQFGDDTNVWVFNTVIEAGAKVRTIVNI